MRTPGNTEPLGENQMVRLGIRSEPNGVRRRHHTRAR